MKKYELDKNDSIKLQEYMDIIEQHEAQKYMILEKYMDLQESMDLLMNRKYNERWYRRRFKSQRTQTADKSGNFWLWRFCHGEFIYGEVYRCMTNW